MIRRSAAPRRGVHSPPEQELLGAMTSLGPSRECYKPSRKSRGRPAKTAGAPTAASTVSAESGRRKRLTRRQGGAPRSRRCLLKGCEQRFRPRRARQRYCSEPCRKAARAWSRWKAQERYRDTATGKQQRNGQSRRYRERVRDRKPPASEAVPDAARVITKKFFRHLL